MIGGIVAGLNHGMHKMSNGEPEAKRKQIVKRAKAHNGSKDWAYENKKGRFAANTNKCNLFVDDILGEVGIYTPDPNGKLSILGLGTPVTAGQWVDPNYNIPGW